MIQMVATWLQFSTEEYVSFLPILAWHTNKTNTTYCYFFRGFSDIILRCHLNISLLLFQDDNFSLSLLNELSVKYGIQTHLSHSPLPQKLEELREFIRREIKKELKIKVSQSERCTGTLDPCYMKDCTRKKDSFRYCEYFCLMPDLRCGMWLHSGFPQLSCNFWINWKWQEMEMNRVNPLMQEGAENLRKVARDKKSVSDVNTIVKKSNSKLTEMHQELQELESQILVSSQTPNAAGVHTLKIRFCLEKTLWRSTTQLSNLEKFQT